MCYILEGIFLLSATYAVDQRFSKSEGGDQLCGRDAARGERYRYMLQSQWSTETFPHVSWRSFNILSAIIYISHGAS